MCLFKFKSKGIDGDLSKITCVGLEIDVLF